MSDVRYQMISSIEETNWQQATTVDSSKWPIEDGNKPTDHQGEAMMMVPKPLGEVAGGVTERHESATTSKLDLLAVLLSNLVGMESQEETKNTNAVDSEEAQGPPTITDLDETSGSGSSRQDVYSPLTPPDSQLSLFYYPSTGGAGTAEYTGPVTYYAAADGGQYFHVDANTAAAWPSVGQQNGTIFQWQAMDAEQSEQEEQDNSAEVNYDRQEPATPAEEQVDRHEAPRSLPSSSSANEKTLLELAAKFSRMRFPAKLWNLANDDNFGPITWSVNGTSLIIDEFALEPTLHYFFRSHKYSSFLRQLHLYGFRKVTRMRSYKGDQEQERTSYINEYSARDFVRGRLDLLHKVRRFYSAAPKKDKRDKKLLSTPPPTPTPVPIYTVNSPHHQFLEEHSYYSLTPVMFAIAPQELQQYHQNNISPILVDDSSSSSSSSASSASSASDMHGALHSAPPSF